MGVMTHRLKATAIEAWEVPDRCSIRESSPEKMQEDGSVLQRARTFRELHGAVYGGWFLGNVAGGSKGHAMGSLNPRRRIGSQLGSWRVIRGF